MGARHSVYVEGPDFVCAALPWGFQFPLWHHFVVSFLVCIPGDGFDPLALDHRCLTVQRNLILPQ